MKGTLTAIALLLSVFAWGCGANGESVASGEQSVAEVPRSVVSGANGPSTAPPSREDGAIQGQIVQYETRSGAELDMQPEEMTIYIYDVTVRHSTLPGLSAGDRVTLRSKLAPPKDWEGREISMQAAEFAGGASYWLTAFQ